LRGALNLGGSGGGGGANVVSSRRRLLLEINRKPLRLSADDLSPRQLRVRTCAHCFRRTLPPRKTDDKRHYIAAQTHQGSNYRIKRASLDRRRIRGAERASHCDEQ